MIDFEWDQQKASRNKQKHGVSFSEVSTAFADPLSLTIFDPDHSETEDRFLLLGQAASGRLLVVCHTERGGTIRIINARSADRRERAEYERKA
ncbi:MAG: BrnT family toxin [Nitrosospira sp.]|nr:BrnT family toxin [Nitrosospira sp.]